MSEEIIARDECVALIRRSSEHFDLFQGWYANDGEWQRYDAPWEDVRERDVEEARIKYLQAIEKEQAGKYGRLVIKVQDEYVGWVSIYDDAAHPGSKMVGIDICEDTRLNQGIGTRALKLCVGYVFRAYGCHRVGLTTWSFNERMIRVAGKVGFVEEGREKKAQFWNGEWLDRCDFGILKQAWEG
jgi:RimJ/RimL family protein N-acetyltransferase